MISIWISTKYFDLQIEQILSLDYDIMSDEFLKTFELLPLKKLIIHIHGISSDHPGISESAWNSFKDHNASVELYLTLVSIYHIRLSYIN